MIVRHPNAQEHAHFWQYEDDMHDKFYLALRISHPHDWRGLITERFIRRTLMNTRERERERERMTDAGLLIRHPPARSQFVSTHVSPLNTPCATIQNRICALFIHSHGEPPTYPICYMGYL